MKQITPVREVRGIFSAPPSKAITLRGLFLSTLCPGNSTLSRALHAEDQVAAARVLEQLGADIQFEKGIYSITGTGGHLVRPDSPLHTGKSGVTTRFLLPLAAAVPGTVTVDADEQMRERPVKDLLNALSHLGVELDSNDGHLPVRIRGDSLPGGKTAVGGTLSSQPVSALLLAGPLADGELLIQVDHPLRSRPYVDLTVEMMKACGVKVERNGYDQFRMGPDQSYSEPLHWNIPGDMTIASCFLGAAAITGGQARVGPFSNRFQQGDAYILELLEEMGCSVERDGGFIKINGDTLEGIDVHLRDHPDLVPTLAALAPFARGETRITGIHHLRVKESNRIEAISDNLSTLGVQHKADDSSLRITGSVGSGGIIEPHGDHRIAMAFALPGLRVPGIKIRNPSVVRKSFPGYFDELETGFKRDESPL